MRQKIDCFLACRSPHDIEQTLAQLRGSRTIQHINILVSETAEASDCVFEDCGVIAIDRITSSQTMLFVAERAAFIFGAVFLPADGAMLHGHIRSS